MGYVLVHDYRFLAIRPYSHPGFFIIQMLQTQVYGEDYSRHWGFHETRKYFSHAEKGWFTILKTMITLNI